jgi:hypothetical protein
LLLELDMPLCEKLMIQLTSLLDLIPTVLYCYRFPLVIVHSSWHRTVTPLRKSRTNDAMDAMRWDGSGNGRIMDRSFVRPIHGALRRHRTLRQPAMVGMGAQGAPRSPPCGMWESKSGQLFGGDVVLIAPNRIGGMASAKWPTRRLRPYPVRENAQPAACPRRRRLRARAAKANAQRNRRDAKQNPNVRTRPQPTPDPGSSPTGKNLLRRTHADDGDRPEPRGRPATERLGGW